MTRLLILLAMCTAGLLGGGCGEKPGAPAPSSPAAATSPAARAATPPPVPGLNAGESATDALLVRPASPDKAAARYTWDEKMDAGMLRVICTIPSVQADLPEPKPIDFTGPMAIRDPATVEPYKVIYDGIRPRGYDIKNELEYYKNWNTPTVETPLSWLVSPRRGETGLAVNGAAIIVEGIKTGAREELERGGAQVCHKDRNYIVGTHNYGGYNVAFVPPNEKITFTSGDHFPCEIAIKDLRTGEPLGEPFTLPALPFKREGMYAGWMLRANAGSATQPWPIATASPTFRAKSIYHVRCLRHPWQTGYAIVVDNPYVAVSGAGNLSFPSTDGRVTMDKIPPGTWKVRIWHPLLEPVKEEHEVKIVRDETTHLVVEFKPPKELPGK